MPSSSMGFWVAKHVEGLVELVGAALNRNPVLLHRLQQGGLGLRRGAVDLVGEDDVGEDGPGCENH